MAAPIIQPTSTKRIVVVFPQAATAIGIKGTELNGERITDSADNSINKNIPSVGCDSMKTSKIAINS